MNCVGGEDALLDRLNKTLLPPTPIQENVKHHHERCKSEFTSTMRMISIAQQLTDWNNDDDGDVQGQTVICLSWSLLCRYPKEISRRFRTKKAIFGIPLCVSLSDTLSLFRSSERKAAGPSTTTSNSELYVRRTGMGALRRQHAHKYGEIGFSSRYSFHFACRCGGRLEQQITCLLVSKSNSPSPGWCASSIDQWWQWRNVNYMHEVEVRVAGDNVLYH